MFCYFLFEYKLHLDNNISGQKKDPGIPNLFPFKEEILKQAEEKKRRVSLFSKGNFGKW